MSHVEHLDLIKGRIKAMDEAYRHHLAAGNHSEAEVWFRKWTAACVEYWNAKGRSEHVRSGENRKQKRKAA
jgi:hypothetical protein